MKSAVKILFLALITVGVIIFLAKTNYEKIIVQPNSESSDKITFQIVSGESVDSIIQKMVDNGILKEKWINYFKIYVKLNKIAEKIQAGTYEIPKNLSIEEIAETIQKSRGLDIWVTIPEGLRKDQVADMLATELVKGGNQQFSKEEFLALTTDENFISTLGFTSYTPTNLEGFLFPDKYAFSVDETTQDVLLKMISNFKNKVGLDDTYENLIIASMVEREGRTDEDRPMIADIIKKRYDEGWLLQICATILYFKQDWEHVITKEDMAESNPYNTYKNPGLPPTPICNPGLSAINAVRNPKSNPYYYYIHDDDGNIHYGRTLEEHNRNIETYLR